MVKTIQRPVMVAITEPQWKAEPKLFWLLEVLTGDLPVFTRRETVATNLTHEHQHLRHYQKNIPSLRKMTEGVYQSPTIGPERLCPWGFTKYKCMHLFQQGEIPFCIFSRSESNEVGLVRFYSSCRAA